MDIKIVKEDEDYKKGCYGTVIFDKEKRRAIKVFRKNDDIKGYRIERDINGDAVIKGNNFIRAVFESERKAYEKIWSNELNDDDNAIQARKLVPEYYGTIIIKNIFNEKNIDISNKFLLDCNFVIDYIEGNEILNDKGINSVNIMHQNIFKALGIVMVDCSSITDSSGKITYIDFCANKYEVYA